ncbi:MAG: FAD-dependent oxidoreductase [Bacteroidales bacterium]
MSHPVLVLGGGIGGITAALELAEAGQEVILVEKEPYLGGNVSRFNNYFPKLCPPSCGLEINYRRIRSNQRITYYTSTALEQVEGSVGAFEVTLRSEAALINDRCTACGKCAEVCPVGRNAEDASAGEEKAAYIRDGIPFPMRYTIDEGVCEKEACGRCLEVCTYGAIRLDAVSITTRKTVHAIIVATGWHSYDADKIENYRYREDPDVMTNLEFERWLASGLKEKLGLKRPSDGNPPKRLAFVQCAGSRDRHHLAYCSAVCCSATIKHALTLAEHSPETEVEVFYIDLRLTGRNETLLRKAESTGSITLTKGKVGRIIRNEGQGELELEVEDIMKGTRRTGNFDLVVLATGLVPNHPGQEWTTGPEGFLLNGSVPGIVPAGTSKRPMDVASTVRDATAAALKTMQG